MTIKLRSQLLPYPRIHSIQPRPKSEKKMIFFILGYVWAYEDFLSKGKNTKGGGGLEVPATSP